MDFGIIAFLTSVFFIALFLIQRSESRRRLVVLIGFLLVGELIRRYTWFRDVHAEAWLSLSIAFVLNVAFYLFIGRYNPVGSSDDIQVIGMDD
jgi:hypothetical protein